MDGVARTNLAKVLRYIRARHDITQKEMAEVLGVTGSFLSAVERGKRKPPTGWSDELAQRYNLSTAEELHLRIYLQLAAGTKVTAAQFRKMLRTLGLPGTPGKLHVDKNELITEEPDEDMEALRKIMVAEKSEDGYRLTGHGISFLCEALGAEITGE